MDRADVTSGAAFKTALRATLVLFCILILTGAGSFFYLRQEMLAEIKAQIREDEILIGEIHRSAGPAGLRDVVGALSQPLPERLHVFALFDRDGRPLAGEIASPPPAAGWAEIDVPSDGAVERYLVLRSDLAGLSLVIGRNLATVAAKERQMLALLAASGLIVSAAFLLLGYRASHKSLRKLDNMARVLNRVSQGESAARLRISAQNDQIDRVARAMNLHLDRLSGMMATTRASAAAIAHDLRTPLSRAFLALDQAQRLVDADDDPRDALDDIARELTRLRSIFDVILRISRLEQAEAGAAMPTIRLAPILADLAETFGVLAEEKGQALDLSPASADLAMRGEAAMVSQLLANLLQNAITHSPPGAKIRFGAAAKGNDVHLWVADTGPGIAPAERAKVFELFYSIDPNRTGGGNGLGLALVKAIADRLGGRITLSDAAPGLHVDVAFPRPADAA